MRMHNTRNDQVAGEIKAIKDGDDNKIDLQNINADVKSNVAAVLGFNGEATAEDMQISRNLAATLKAQAANATEQMVREAAVTQSTMSEQIQQTGQAANNAREDMQAMQKVAAGLNHTNHLGKPVEAMINAKNDAQIFQRDSETKMKKEKSDVDRVVDHTKQSVQQALSGIPS